MFYSHQLLARKASLGQIWMAATMHAKINRRKLDKLNIIYICQEILNPSVPMALRLSVSGILMGGVAIVYEHKVKLLYEDVTRLLVEINEAWKVNSVADPTVLPKGKSQAKYEAVTLPENQEAELGEIEQSLHYSNSNTIMGFQQTAYFAMRLDNVVEPFVSHNPKEQDLPQNHHQADPANITIFEHFDSYQADTSTFNLERFDNEGGEDEAQGNFAPQEHTEIRSTLIRYPPLPEVPQKLIAEPGGVFISDPKKPLSLAPACVLGEDWSGMQSDTKLIIGSGSRSGRKRDSDDKEEKLPQKKTKDVQPIKQIGDPWIKGEDQFRSFLKDHLGEKMLVLKVPKQPAFKIYVPKTDDSKWFRPTVDLEGYSILDNVGSCLLLSHKMEQKFCHYDILSGSKRDLPKIPKKKSFPGDAKGTFEPDGITVLMTHNNGKVFVLVFTPDQRRGTWRRFIFPLKSIDPPVGLIAETEINEIEGLSLNHRLVWAITKGNRIFRISVDGEGSWLYDCHNPIEGPITHSCLVKDEIRIWYIGIREGENCSSILLNHHDTFNGMVSHQREILISQYKGIIGKELEDEASGVKIYVAKGHRDSLSDPVIELTLYSGVNANSQIVKYCDNYHGYSTTCLCTRAWIIV